MAATGTMIAEAATLAALLAAYSVNPNRNGMMAKPETPSAPVAAAPVAATPVAAAPVAAAPAAAAPAAATPVDAAPETVATAASSPAASNPEQSKRSWSLFNRKPSEPVDENPQPVDTLDKIVKDAIIDATSQTFAPNRGTMFQRFRPFANTRDAMTRRKEAYEARFNRLGKRVSVDQMKELNSKLGGRRKTRRGGGNAFSKRLAARLKVLKPTDEEPRVSFKTLVTVEGEAVATTLLPVFDAFISWRTWVMRTPLVYLPETVADAETLFVDALKVHENINPVFTKRSKDFKDATWYPKATIEAARVAEVNRARDKMKAEAAALRAADYMRQAEEQIKEGEEKGKKAAADRAAAAEAKMKAEAATPATTPEPVPATTSATTPDPVPATASEPVPEESQPKYFYVRLDAGSRSAYPVVITPLAGVKDQYKIELHKSIVSGITPSAWWSKPTPYITIRWVGDIDVLASSVHDLDIISYNSSTPMTSKLFDTLESAKAAGEAAYREEQERAKKMWKEFEDKNKKMNELLAEALVKVFRPMNAKTKVEPIDLAWRLFNNDPVPKNKFFLAFHSDKCSPGYSIMPNNGDDTKFCDFMTQNAESIRDVIYLKQPISDRIHEFIALADTLDPAPVTEAAPVSEPAAPATGIYTTEEEISNHTICASKVPESPVGTLTKIPGDGWCYYSAVLAANNEPYTTEDAKKLATEIQVKLRSPEYRDKSEKLWDQLERSVTFNEYLENMATQAGSDTRFWGEGDINSPIVAVIKRKIVAIYQDGVKTDGNIFCPSADDVEGASGVISIEYNGVNHFDAYVTPKSEPVLGYMPSPEPAQPESPIELPKGLAERLAAAKQKWESLKKSVEEEDTPAIKREVVATESAATEASKLLETSARSPDTTKVESELQMILDYATQVKNDLAIVPYKKAAAPPRPKGTLRVKPPTIPSLKKADEAIAKAKASMEASAKKREEVQARLKSLRGQPYPLRGPLPKAGRSTPRNKMRKSTFRRNRKH